MTNEFANQRSGMFKRHGLLSLFALTLALSVILGTVPPLQSQPVSPSPQTSASDPENCFVPADLCEQIKQRAQTHVEQDGKKRTDEVIKSFTALHPDWKDNLSEPEIAKIRIAIGDTYEGEYNKQDEIRKRDPQVALEIFFENGLWVPSLLAMLGIIFAWFRDAIGKAWLALIKSIDDWIYERFAGTPLFEGLALQRYREALVDHYQHLKIPFRVNQKPLEMSEVYVPLKVAGSSDSDQVDAYGAIAQYRRMMITGIPGSGKTMLLRHVAFSYGKGGLTGLEYRPVPVLVELHRLSDPALTEEELIAAIVEAFKRNRFPNADRFVRHSLEHGKLMLLLDGLDEVNSGVRPVLVQRISDLLKSLDEHQRCRLIVTCRTAVYDHEFAHETDQTLEVVEFSDQQMRRFLLAWRQEIPAGKSIDQLMQTLRDRPQIMALARNPLLLTIIVHLYTEPAFELPRSRAGFYRESTRILLEQWQDQFNRYRGSDKRRVLQYLALYQQQASTQQQRDRRSIDYPVVLEQIRQLLPSLNLDPSRDTTPLLEELVERSGLFLKIDGGDRYQFAHLTLQEYFAAVALADKSQDLIQFFQQDPTTWREVVKLWCGIAGNSTALIMEVCRQDQILGFECLADAQEIDQQTAESIIEHCKGLLGTTGTQDDVTKAFGAVAASDRPRGQAIFQFLAAALNQPAESHRFGAIAQALSFTNRPQAAKVLATRYAEMGEIVRQHLVRMGDLAVPELAQLAAQGEPSAIADLYAIGTPDAAVALVPLLWGIDQNANIAAWCLASLLLQPGVEEALKTCDLSKLGNNTSQVLSAARAFAWVWEPFQDSPNSAMTAIMSRLAAQLTHEPHPMASTSALVLDPRLVVPILAIQSHQTFPLPSTENLEQIDVLLAQREYTPQLNQQARQLVNALLAQSEPDKGWQALLTSLPPRFQLDLFRRLGTATRPPTHHDWLNIFQSVQYEFKTSRHYRGILQIAALLSLLAGFGIWHTASVQPIGAATGVLGFAIVVVSVFWRALAKGVEEPWEPSLFVKLGALGLQTYGVELHQLFQNRLVWSGIKVIFKLFRSKGAVADAVAFAFAGAFAFAFAGAVAVAFAGAVAGAFAGAGAGAVAVAGAVAFAVAGAADFASAVDFAGAFAFAYLIGILAGLGLGSWYRLKAEPAKQWLKFFAVLALPWFCAAPIVLVFAGVGLATLFTPLAALLSIPPWLAAGLVEFCLVGVSTWLWRWGQNREAMARNPLQGGLIEATLRARYGRPRL